MTETEWHEHCELMLNALSGMSLREFASLLNERAEIDLAVLKQVNEASDARNLPRFNLMAIRHAFDTLRRDPTGQFVFDSNAQLETPSTATVRAIEAAL